jgi:hypothetical protein
MARISQSDGKTKKCYECSSYLAVDATVCHACKRRVGPRGKDGIAKKPFSWSSYSLMLLTWIAFGLYLYWAFILEKN